MSSLEAVKRLDNVVVMETYKPSGEAMDDAYMQAFEERTRGTLDPGESIAGFRIEPLSVPTEGSVHYSYTFVSKKGKPLYRYGYVSGSEHKVFVSTSTDTPGEPGWFKRMVVSLRRLKEP